MQEVQVPWGNWYAQTTRTLSFPDGWDVRLCKMPHVPALSREEIERKMQSPVASPALRALAAGKKSACIVMDDISRPTPGDRLVPIVIEQLKAAGMDYENIQVVIALGGHRPMTRRDMQKKLGDWVLGHVQVHNHVPFSPDLVTVPADGQVIKINRVFMQSELKIAVGCLIPHSLAGFSGGAKAVLPGIGGIETIYDNHTLVFSDIARSKSFKTSTLMPDNPMRNNMEAIVGKCGLDFIVNVILNDEMQAADVFCGHFIKAHRAACERATAYYRTELVERADILIASAFPKDTEYSQLGTCFAVLGQEKRKCVKPDGTLVCMTAASEGGGYHALFGPGMRLFSPHDDNIPPAELSGMDTVIFSDGVGEPDIRPFYRNRPRKLCTAWPQVLEHLEARLEGRNPLVAIYPMGSIQIGVLPKA
jgi:nickel-dependent lactate racemase